MRGSTQQLNTDPSQYPDENPLADKGGGSSPTPAEIQQYADGLVDPTQIAYENSYAYRGLDESQATNKDNPYPTHLGTSPRSTRSKTASGRGAELMLGTPPTCHCSRYFSVSSGVNHSGTRPSNGKNSEGFSAEPSLRSGPAEYDVEL